MIPAKPMAVVALLLGYNSLAATLHDSVPADLATRSQISDPLRTSCADASHSTSSRVSSDLEPALIKACASAQGIRVAVDCRGRLLSAREGASWQPRAAEWQTFFRDVAYAHGQFVAAGGSYLGTLAGVILTSSDGEHWAIQRCGIKSVLYGVSYGAGRFVAVGDSGTVLVSCDGNEWTKVRAPFGGMLASVAYGGGRFVAVGEDGIVLASVDGKKWARQFSPTSEYLSSVHHENSRFFASANGRILEVAADPATDARYGLGAESPSSNR